MFMPLTCLIISGWEFVSYFPEGFTFLIWGSMKQNNRREWLNSVTSFQTVLHKSVHFFIFFAFQFSSFYCDMLRFGIWSLVSFFKVNAILVICYDLAFDHTNSRKLNWTFLLLKMVLFIRWVGLCIDNMWLILQLPFTFCMIYVCSGN
jgi:hypothetical protein